MMPEDTPCHLHLAFHNSLNIIRLCPGGKSFGGKKMRKAFMVFVAALFLVGLFSADLLAQAQQQAPKAEQKAQPAQKEANKVNINKASKAELAKLPGIGDKIAEEIIKYREKNGPFKTIQDIKKVSGVGDKKFEAIKNMISVE
jgi:competence protein ComEA